MLTGAGVPTAPADLVMRFVSADACYLSTTQIVNPDGRRGGVIYHASPRWEKNGSEEFAKPFE